MFNEQSVHPAIPDWGTARIEAELNWEQSRVSNQLSDAVGGGESPFSNKTSCRTSAADCMLIHERKLSLYAASSAAL
jgi:hypothetical protein